MGLALVKAVAEAHGGSVAVRSAEGQGATFTMIFPVDGAFRKVPQENEISVS